MCWYLDFLVSICIKVSPVHALLPSFVSRTLSLSRHGTHCPVSSIIDVHLLHFLHSPFSSLVSSFKQDSEKSLRKQTFAIFCEF